MELEHILGDTYGVRDEDGNYTFFISQIIAHVWAVENEVGEELRRFRTMDECKAYILGRLEG